MFTFDPLAERARLAAIIQANAEDGLVAIVTHGKPLTILRATLQNVLRWERKFYRIADYTTPYQIKRPSSVRPKVTFVDYDPTPFVAVACHI